jgi:hypothetical protein
MCCVLRETHPPRQIDSELFVGHDKLLVVVILLRLIGRQQGEFYQIFTPKLIESRWR